MAPIVSASVVASASAKTSPRARTGRSMRLKPRTRGPNLPGVQALATLDLTAQFGSPSGEPRADVSRVVLPGRSALAPPSNEGLERSDFGLVLVRQPQPRAHDPQSRVATPRSDERAGDAFRSWGGRDVQSVGCRYLHPP